MPTVLMRSRFGADAVGVKRSCSSDVPGRPKRRIWLISLGVALAMSVTGVALTAIWLSLSRDPSCGDSDCDQGVALVAVFLAALSLGLGALCGTITGVVLAVRRRPPGERWRAICQAVFATVVPLALVVLYVVATT